MSYCTTTDVEKELYLPLIAQMKNKWGTDYDAEVISSIASAESFVNSIISPITVTPLTEPAPKAIGIATAKVAAYFISVRFNEREDVSKDKYDVALEMLKAIVKSGRLPDTPIPDVTDDSSTIRSVSNPQVFTSEELALWG